jgi:hypothetical protein
MRGLLLGAAAAVLLGLGPASGAEGLRPSQDSADTAFQMAAGDAAPVVYSAVTAAEAAPPADMSDPAARLLDHTPDEIEPYFDLYIYVSKAAAGPVAQNMFVYQRNFDGSLTLVHQWLVSTGREKRETAKNGRRTFTDTPEGVYKLDPNRMYVNYKSKTWLANMPWAMFLDAKSGSAAGIAIHAAGRSKVSQLGRRASGGCIRLSPANARTLFNLVRNNYAGVVPVFAESGGVISTVGRPARDEFGALVLTTGYRVLLHIEDYPGEEPPVEISAAGDGTQHASH